MPARSIAPGIHLVHKARGETSFSLVRALQARARESASESGDSERALPICHGGALDPFADGLMLLLVGPSTRLMEELHPIPKWYEATIAWGLETDTGDPGGHAQRSDGATAHELASALAQLTPERSAARLAEQLGWRDQVPPATSNKRLDGERAYARAHRGEQFELPPSRVYLHSAAFTAHDLPRTSTLSLCCRGGYYVRSLARDLGRALGVGAHLLTLTRTQIGPWSDRDAQRGSVVIEGPAQLPWLPLRQLTRSEASAIELGRAISSGRIEPASFALPSGFPGPGAGERDRLEPIRGVCDGILRTLLKPRGDQLVLHRELAIE